jgi:hypothetical protein
VRVGASAPAAGRSWWGSGRSGGPAAAGGSDMNGARTISDGDVSRNIFLQSGTGDAERPLGDGHGQGRWRGLGTGGPPRCRMDGLVRPEVVVKARRPNGRCWPDARAPRRRSFMGQLQPST